MSTKPVLRCEHCNAKMVEYRHSLNQQLAECLLALASQGGTIEFRELQKFISFNQRANFPKLQYWGLIAKMRDDETNERVGGLWGLTWAGFHFVRGMGTVNKSVWTYRNEFVRFDGPQIFLKELKVEAFREKSDYVADEKPKYIDESGQVRLFE